MFRNLVSLLFLINILAVPSSYAQEKWFIAQSRYQTTGEADFTSVTASDDNNITVVGYIRDSELLQYHTIVYRSKDGGDTWKPQVSGIPLRWVVTDYKLRKVFAIDSLNVIAVGDSGLIIRTTDAGETWIRQDSTRDWKCMDVAFSDPEHGIIVGNHGIVGLTSDGGKTWNHKEIVPLTVLKSALSPKNGCYFVIPESRGVLYRTFDYGNSWDTVNIVGESMTETEWRYITDITQVSDSVLVAVGGHAYDITTDTKYKTLLMRSTDLGTTWYTSLDSIYTTKFLTASSSGVCVDFADSLHGIVGMRAMMLFTTSDGGVTWSFDSINTAETSNIITDIAMPSVNNVFATGSLFFTGYLYRRLPLSTVRNAKASPLNVRISANPIHTSSTITWESQASPVDVVLLDVLGREVYRYTNITTNRVEININELTNGCYFLLLAGRVRDLGAIPIIIERY